MHTAHYLGADLGSKFFYEVTELSDEAKLLSRAMSKYKLRAQPERSQLFSVYSPQSKAAIAISIVTARLAPRLIRRPRPERRRPVSSSTGAVHRDD